MDNNQAEELVGKYVLLCYSLVDTSGGLLAQFQEAAFCHGITSVIHMRLEDSFDEIYLPPDLSAFKKADPGVYRLRSTGREIVDPDYIASWRIVCPDPQRSLSIPRYHPAKGEFE